MKRAAGFLFALLLPVFSVASGLININTADAVLLNTLPGIGPTLAQRIIDYRAVHGPFVATSDIQNVSGIGISIYGRIASLITVENTVPASSDTGSTTPSAPGRATTYTPPPAELTLTVTGSQNAYLNVPLVLYAQARARDGVDPSAQINWSFGDGSFGTGTETRKVYRYPGTYLVIAVATDGSAKARSELIVTVVPVQVNISSISGDGITLTNGSLERLDLSGWRLLSGTGIFRIPDGTVLLPQSSVLFPYAVTNLPTSLEPVLTYPDGVAAARYAVSATLTPSSVEPQLSAATAGSYEEQTIMEAPAPAPAEHTSINSTAHETTSGLAPAAAIGIAAAGAALMESSTPEKAAHHLPAVLTSPWTLGFLGMMILAGGAFILL